MRGLLQLKRLVSSTSFSFSARRFILSESYKCSDAWNARLSTPLLHQVNVGELLVKVQTKYEKEGIASVVDINILANTLDKIEAQQLDFAVDVFERHNKTRQALLMRDATAYALVRSLLSMGETNKLITIIQDKLTYGVFLESYTCNILMDHFIKKKQYQEAAIIAYDQMFQEDFSDELTKAFSWYSCHLHWKNPVKPVEIDADAEAAEEEDDDEEKYIRVRYIERPYYDDHFDIPKNSMKLGKTFMMLARGDDTVVGRSYTLAGWGLYEKFDKGLELLEYIAQTEGADVTNDALETFVTVLENVETKEPLAEEIEVGRLRLEDLYPYVTNAQKQEYLEKLKDLQETLKSRNKLVDYDLSGHLLNNLQNAVKAKGSEDEKVQTELFAQWNETREEILAKEVEEYKAIEKKKLIAAKILELQKREEKLRYFEEQEKIAIGVVKSKDVKPIDTVFKKEKFVEAPID